MTISGDLIREARLRAGLTQAELARRAGKHQSAIARWEAGRGAPSFETLRQLIRACGLELTFRLANGDDSYVSHINRYLALSPRERLDGALQRESVFREFREQLETARVG